MSTRPPLWPSRQEQPRPAGCLGRGLIAYLIFKAFAIFYRLRSR